jgi:predicted acylesterase/phospholipase RssA
MAKNVRRRGLVLEGGGAKGSYAFGCLLAFKQCGVTFDAVSGTSVGALNGLLWATDTVEKERGTWENLTEKSVFQRKTLLVILPFLFLIHLYGGVLQRLRHRPHLPDTVWIGEFLYAIGTISSIAIYIIIFWRSEIDSTLRHLITVGASITFTILFISGSFVFYRVPWFKVGLNVVTYSIILNRLFLTWNWNTFLIDMLISIPAGLVLILFCCHRLWRTPAVFDSEPLKRLVSRVMSEGVQLPFYVTMAEERQFFDPDDPQWWKGTSRIGTIACLEPERGFFPTYLPVHKTEVGSAVDAVVASAALPFGIANAININGNTYVDGGVVDNCPIYPLAMWEQCEEIIVVKLSVGDLRLGNVIYDLEEIERLERIKDFIPPKTFWEKTGPWPEIEVPYHHNNPPKVIRFKNLKNIKITVLTLSPSNTLGNFITGTMNFSEDYARENIAKGHSDALKFIHQHGLAQADEVVRLPM